MGEETTGPTFGISPTANVPTSFYVLEESIITTKDKDLSYKAWFDIVFSPLLAADNTQYFEEYNKILDGAGRFLDEKPKNYKGKVYGTNAKQPFYISGRNIEDVITQWVILDYAKSTRKKATRYATAVLGSLVKIKFYEPMRSPTYTPIFQMFEESAYFFPPHPWYQATGDGPSPLQSMDLDGIINETLKSEKGFQGNLAGWQNPGMSQPTPSWETVMNITSIAQLQFGHSSSEEIRGGSAHDKREPYWMPQPNSSCSPLVMTQDGLVLLIQHGNVPWQSDQFGHYSLTNHPGHPLIPKQLKIVGGILENSLYQHV